ncbi:MAG: hypothetical protein IPM91_06215 [Bacteroidetes bacterium]|nr:hypothetical protein [Bacteroidota bacterium]
MDSGTLTILQDTLTIKADDKNAVYGNNINYSSVITGLHYDDSLAGISTGAITYTAIDANNNTVPAPVPAGNFSIVPSGLNLITPSDYIVNYLSGDLTITKAQLIAKADSLTRVYGDPNPPLTITYSGFVNGDDKNDIVEPALLQLLYPPPISGITPLR